MTNCLFFFVYGCYYNYADDTIILAKTDCDLQKALDALSDYCKQWKMTVNASKKNHNILSW